MSGYQLIEFVSNHWFLFSALAVILALLGYSYTIGEKGNVDPLTATEMINRQDALVIDVRPSADFHKGHILNASNIPSHGFAQQMHTLEKHKDKPIIINCRSGAQSAIACKQLEKAGFSSVYNLSGGIMAWQNANLPLTRKKKK
jgi:rhodanese-related sulfurtransferase